MFNHFNNINQFKLMVDSLTFCGNAHWFWHACLLLFCQQGILSYFIFNVWQIETNETLLYIVVYSRGVSSFLTLGLWIAQWYFLGVISEHFCWGAQVCWINSYRLFNIPWDLCIVQLFCPVLLALLLELVCFVDDCSVRTRKSRPRASFQRGPCIPHPTAPPSTFSPELYRTHLASSEGKASPSSSCVSPLRTWFSLAPVSKTRRLQVCSTIGYF